MKSSQSPLIVTFVVFAVAFCFLALAIVPVIVVVHGVKWIVQQKANSALAQNKEWMEQIELAVSELPAQEIELATPAAASLAEKTPGTDAQAPDAVETEPTSALLFGAPEERNYTELHQALIKELRQLPAKGKQNRQAWAAVCKHAKVQGGTKVRDSSLENQAEFLAQNKVQLSLVRQAVQTVIAS